MDMDKIINASIAPREKDLLLLLDKAAKTSEGPGLFNGLTGISMCYFILSRITGQQHHRKTALRYLGQVQQSIPAINDLGFAEGLAGIGWAVEWLVQQDYVKANTDTVLADLDDTIYTAVIFSSDVSLSLEDGVIGKALYFLYRMQNRGENKRRYRMVCNLECLVLLSEEIAEKITESISNIEDGDSQNIRNTDLTEIARSLILLLRIFNQKINTATAREAIKRLLLAIERYLMEDIKHGVTSNRGNAYFHLIYAYQLALDILDKKGFTPNSPIITSYIKAMKYTSANLQQHLLAPGGFISSRDDIKGSKSAEPRLLSLLKKINALDNTCYGYEAFLLQ
jgi:hypothetical protein